MKPIRIHLTVFMSLVLVSGLTAFPLRTEIRFLHLHQDIFPPFLVLWINEVYEAIGQCPDLMLYGTDWLAFAHFIIALFFIPVFIDPFRYKLNLKIGMLASLLVFPLAFICGPIRGIPLFHQVIDCCFGVLGFLYLSVILLKINKLQHTHENHH